MESVKREKRRGEKRTQDRTSGVPMLTWGWRKRGQKRRQRRSSK